jgi:hypothetical protein
MPLLITKGNNLKPHVRKTTLSQKVEFGVVSLIFITIVLVCSLALTYLAHTNKIATRAYQLKKIEQERESLITESQILNMKISQVQSLVAIENDPIIASMRSFEAPIFIRGDTAVAASENKNPFYN